MRTPVEHLSYMEASRELDEIVGFFEKSEVDVDQLVARLERATAIVDELDRRIRRTRAQVEELVPKLEAAGRTAVAGQAPEPANRRRAMTTTTRPGRSTQTTTRRKRRFRSEAGAEESGGRQRDRQPREASKRDRVPMSDPRIRELDVLEPRQQAAETHLSLEPGQRGTEAVVDSAPEAHGRPFVARQVEGLGSANRSGSRLAAPSNVMTCSPGAIV